MGCAAGKPGQLFVSSNHGSVFGDGYQCINWWVFRGWRSTTWLRIYRVAYPRL